MAAAVPDVGQRVVLGQQRDRRTGRAHARAERGRQARETLLDAVPVLLEERGDARDGAMLLVRELWIGVDLARQAHEILSEAVHRAHALMRSRRARSVATRTAAAPSASAVMSAFL